MLVDVSSNIPTGTTTIILEINVGGGNTQGATYGNVEIRKDNNSRIYNFGAWGEATFQGIIKVNNNGMFYYSYSYIYNSGSSCSLKLIGYY